MINDLPPQILGRVNDTFKVPVAVYCNICLLSPFSGKGVELEHPYLAYATLSSGLHMEAHIFLTLGDFLNRVNSC